MGCLWGVMQTDFGLQVGNISKLIPSQNIKKRVKYTKIRVLQAKAYGKFSFYDRCRSVHSAREVIKMNEMKLALHVSLCRREHITSSYLTKVARYFLGDGVSSIEDRRSATLKRVPVTSLKLADCAAASWRRRPSLSHGRQQVCRRLVCREWRRSPESTPLGSLSMDSLPPLERASKWWILKV